MADNQTFTGEDMWPRDMNSTPHGPSIDMVNVVQLAGILGGSALALYGFTRRSLPGLVLAGVGGMIASRCMTGSCPVSSVHNYPYFANRPADPDIEKNQVDEASWESFPASDAPSHSHITS